MLLARAVRCAPSRVAADGTRSFKTESKVSAVLASLGGKAKKGIANMSIFIWNGMVNVDNRVVIDVKDANFSVKVHSIFYTGLGAAVRGWDALDVACA